MHVKRQRRTATNGPGILGHSSTRRRRLVVVGTSAALALSGGVAWAGTTSFGQDEVGQQTARGLVLPSDQTIDPIGDRLLVDNGKLLASTISPDGTRMAATTNDRAIALTIVDLKSYRVQQQAGTSPDADLKISTLEAANAELKVGLIALHAEVERRTDPAARALEAKIWSELAAGAERRKLAGSPV